MPTGVPTSTLVMPPTGTTTPTSEPTSTLVAPPTLTTPTGVPTSTLVATPTVTTTTVPTKVPTFAPTAPPALTATSGPTATGPAQTLPEAPACSSPSPSGFRRKIAVRDDPGRLQGGDHTTLQADKLPANTTFVILYDGPRWRLQGTTATKLPFSIRLGTATTDGKGTLSTTVRLPVDAMYGTAHIRAFDTKAVRTAPLHVWDLNTAPHDPWLEVSAPVGTNFVITRGITPPSAAASCSAKIPTGGTAIVPVSPGQNMVSVINAAGEIQSHLTLGLPGETVRLPLQPIIDAAATLHLNGCDTKLRELGQYDNLSGNEFTMNGLGPFGEFLSGIKIDDTVLVTLGSADGSSIPAVCVPRLKVALRDVNARTVQQLGVFGPAQHSDVDNYLASLFPRAQALADAWGGSVPYSNYFNATKDAFAKNSINYLIHVNPGSVSPGEGDLQLSVTGPNASDVSLFTPNFRVFKQYWDSPEFNLSSGPSFDPSTRTYSASGNIPRDAITANYPLHLGWKDQKPIPDVDYPIENSLRIGISLDESFSTDGVWYAAPRAVAQSTLVNQKWLDETLPLSPVYNDTEAPGIKLDQLKLGAGLHWHSPDPIASIPIYGFTIPVIGDVGVTGQLHIGADGDAYLSSHINPDFSIKDVTMTGVAKLNFSAEVDFSAVVGGIAAGAEADLALAFPIVYTSGAGVTTSACFSGHLDVFARYWYDVWFTSGGGDFFRVKLFSVHLPSGCSTGNLHSLRAERLREAIGQRLPAGVDKRILEPQIRYVRLQAPATPPAAHLHTAPSVSVDARGRGASVWVLSDSVARRDRLITSTTTGGAWSSPASIATSNAAILSPRVAELGDGRAVATWVQNTLTPKDAPAIDRLQRAGKPGEVIAMMLRHQEMFTATLSHGRWSTPQRLTHDSLVDNGPALAADTQHHTAMLVWTRGLDSRTMGLVSSRFNGHAWTAPSAVPGTRGTSPGGAALTWQRGSYALAWIAGAAKNSVRMVALSGGRWTAPRNPGLPVGAQALSLAPHGTGLALAASIVDPKGKGGSAIWTAVSTGNTWKTQKISDDGRNPARAGAGQRGTILTYSQPQDAGFSQGTSQIADAVAPPNGAFSAPGLITGQQDSAQIPAIAVDPKTKTLRLLYQQLAPQGAAPVTTDPAWRLALNPQTKVLDTASGVQASSVPLQAHVFANFAEASLNVPHPSPGQKVTLTVPVYNAGLLPAKASGAIVVKAGNVTVARLRLQKKLAVNARYLATITFAAPPSAISLHGKGIRSLPGADLGVPLQPAKLSVGTTASGDAELRWTTPPDHDVVEYRLYRATGSSRYELAGLSHDTVFVDPGTEGVKPGDLRYAVTAVDAQGRESALSNDASVGRPGQ